MNPEPQGSLLSNPNVETGGMSFILYASIVLIKIVFPLETKPHITRLIVVGLAFFYSFGEMYLLPEKPPDVTRSGLFIAFCRAILMLSSAFGINHIESIATQKKLLATGPLAPAAEALQTAKDATTRVETALNQAKEAIGTAAPLLPLPETPAPTVPESPQDASSAPQGKPTGENTNIPE